MNVNIITRYNVPIEETLLTELKENELNEGTINETWGSKYEGLFVEIKYIYMDMIQNNHDRPSGTMPLLTQVGTSQKEKNMITHATVFHLFHKTWAPFVMKPSQVTFMTHLCLKTFVCWNELTFPKTLSMSPPCHVVPPGKRGPHSQMELCHLAYYRL